MHINVEKRDIEGQSSEIGLVITVEDTGIGIPLNDQAVIFEAFKQKDGQSTKRFGGTGLGLSITKRLVEMMGGTIGVESKENQGSRFRIEIPHVPVAAAEVTADAGEEFNPDAIVFDSAKVLVADDIATNRLLVKEFLRSTNLSAMEAANGEDAVNLALFNMMGKAGNEMALIPAGIGAIIGMCGSTAIVSQIKTKKSSFKITAG